MFDIPSEEDLINWRKIKVLKLPLGLKEVLFKINASKESYIDQGSVEVEVDVAPEFLHILPENVQAKIKQYGFKHNISITIHEAMGCTLTIVATEISLNNSNFKMWYKGQIIVITSCTKYAKYTIFVGDNNDTLAALNILLIFKTLWMDYIQSI